MRRHAATEGVAAEPQRQLRALGRRSERSRDALGRDGRRIDAVAARRDEREVEAQGRDAALLERRRNRLHARVAHAGSGPVR